MNALTRVISTRLDSVARRIVKVLRYGKSDVQEAIETSPYGTDSNPIKNMVAIYAETAVKGRVIIIGYINKNQLAAVGEHRVYSTDENGNLKTYIWLHNDGTMDIGGNSNHMTQFEALKSAFDKFVSDFNAHSHASNGAPPTTPTTADMSGAKLSTIKTI